VALAGGHGNEVVGLVSCTLLSLGRVLAEVLAGRAAPHHAPARE
jgi:hypothetical protein